MIDIHNTAGARNKTVVGAGARGGSVGGGRGEQKKKKRNQRGCLLPRQLYSEICRGRGFWSVFSPVKTTNETDGPSAVLFTRTVKQV